MIKFEIRCKTVNEKDLFSLYAVFRENQRDVSFLLVPFPSMSDRQKMYFYDLLKKHGVAKVSAFSKGNASGAQ